MALKVRKIAEIEELNTFLRGGIIGGRDIRRGILGLIDGKTLVFLAPAVTITFATTPSGEQVGLTVKEILTQLNTGALTGFAKIDSAGRVVIEDPAGATAVVLDVSVSTGEGLFGFGGAVDHAGTVYGTPGSGAPELVSVDSDGLGSGTYLVTTDE